MRKKNMQNTNVFLLSDFTSKTKCQRVVDNYNSNVNCHEFVTLGVFAWLFGFQNLEYIPKNTICAALIFA